ncbi:hypothetical protein [Rhizobium rhizosphaerae]|uniref:hypothetical protein n=1 Tax=Xaviernesmea rhizosphaerae TaxID=1672749 RepID=UPI00111A9DE7|nr:hypothetical protein [Xaviernesmea rhizosphaerae]
MIEASLVRQALFKHLSTTSAALQEACAAGNERKKAKTIKGWLWKTRKTFKMAKSAIALSDPRAGAGRAHRRAGRPAGSYQRDFA